MLVMVILSKVTILSRVIQWKMSSLSATTGTDTSLLVHQQLNQETCFAKQLLKKIALFTFNNQTQYFAQVLANLEKQSFAEAWGMLAKKTFPDALLNTFTDPNLKTLIKKIDVLGPANLPTTERERVSLHGISQIRDKHWSE